MTKPERTHREMLLADFKAVRAGCDDETFYAYVDSWAAHCVQLREALDLADSAVSWCVARHAADEETKKANAAIQRITRSREDR